MAAQPVGVAGQLGEQPRIETGTDRDANDGDRLAKFGLGKADAKPLVYDLDDLCDTIFVELSPCCFACQRLHDFVEFYVCRALAGLLCKGLR